jgi:hypothetical protein
MTDDCRVSKTWNEDLRDLLNTNWSKIGICFNIMQKHCTCKELSLRCCRDGWKLRYAIEGEALAVAWGLDRGNHFLLGCWDLVIGVDHKPLVGLFAEDKALLDIKKNQAAEPCREGGKIQVHCPPHSGGAEQHPGQLVSVPGGGPGPSGPQGRGLRGAGRACCRAGAIGGPQACFRGLLSDPGEGRC